MKRLRKLRHLAGKACLAVLCCAVSFSVYAEQFMPVSDVRPGMTGYAKTVARGTQIETFPVEILGVMKNSGPSGDLILARFSGPLIEQTGGIAPCTSMADCWGQLHMAGLLPIPKWV